MTTQWLNSGHSSVSTLMSEETTLAMAQEVTGQREHQ